MRRRSSKGSLKRLLWRLANFSGVRLVTDCVMDNHFHALVDVPRREVWLERFAGPAGEENLFEHLRRPLKTADKVAALLSR
ncbi:hypothetical protein SAMN02745166_01569 [Prosthecobacter debontii]|uniref:Transposase IS200 like n=1 Tax=Prosthecobacter debontii TaxID=48467 RepID=A0A1T4XIT6_9BACT|nr:hypothetical protein [Prosthecobacter debontii]SKA89323.1 hypothetical protein SAMN02745166_01569 [Prosthecobacter debontii]